MRNQFVRSCVSRRIRMAKDRGKIGARIRWGKDKARRERLAALDPIRVGGRILERWVRIINETVVRERTVFEFDRPVDVRRKRRELFA